MSLTILFVEISMLISLRFKDNNIIDKDLYSYDKTLEIFDARGLNGSYRCRAVNMFGAEFSNPAILEVLGKYFVHSVIQCLSLFPAE